MAFKPITHGGSGSGGSIPFPENPYPDGTGLLVSAGPTLFPAQGPVQSPPLSTVQVQALAALKLTSVGLNDAQFDGPTGQGPSGQQTWAFEANVLCDTLTGLLNLANVMQSTVVGLERPAWAATIPEVVKQLEVAIAAAHGLCIKTSATVNKAPATVPQTPGP